MTDREYIHKCVMPRDAEHSSPGEQATVTEQEDGTLELKIGYGSRVRINRCPFCGYEAKEQYDEDEHTEQVEDRFYGLDGKLLHFLGTVDKSVLPSRIEEQTFYILEFEDDQGVFVKLNFAVEFDGEHADILTVRSSLVDSVEQFVEKLQSNGSHIYEEEMSEESRADVNIMPEDDN